MKDAARPSPRDRNTRAPSPTNVAKVAISLPPDLYAAMERARLAAHLDRSRWVQEAVRRYLTDREREEKIAAYIRGYTEVPETEDELEFARDALRLQVDLDEFDE